MKFCFTLLCAIGLVAAVNGMQISPECLASPNDESPMECCKAPKVIPPKEKFTECLSKFPVPIDELKSGNLPPNHNCLAQCMFEQQGVMTDGMVDKDSAISKMVAVMGSSADWQAAAKSSAETCYQKVAAVGAEKDGQGCSVMAGSFIECMPSLLFINCPSSAWKDSTECDQLKAHLEKGCSIMTIWKGPPPH
ncbi:general odorant-binding protein 67-like [Armigeres subalbatus]|uniref:general odorant-binding protein 67-like n=1 Tax=Armigeres subalbatus TaxID=124917 RepID=UPI002ED1774E